MAIINKNMYGGTLSTSSSTLYCSVKNKVIIKEIILCNKSETTASATILINSINIISEKIIESHDTYVVSLSTVLEVNSEMGGYSNRDNSLECYISGYEISESYW